MKKLNLNELKIQSFVTSVDKDNVETVKGGTNGRVSRFQFICDSTPENCGGGGTNGCGSNNCDTNPFGCRPSGNQFICDTSVNCF